MDQSELIQSFIEEAQEHLQSIEPDLLDIEKNGSNVDSEVINRVFRAVHSIKGAAGFLGFKNVGDLSHVMENLLSLLRDKRIDPTPEMIDGLLSGVDMLTSMMNNLNESESIDTTSIRNELKSLIDNKEEKPKKIVKPKKIKKPKVTICELSEEELMSYIDKGQYLYLVTVQLNSDFMNQGILPLAFINKMESTGIYLDGVLDITPISGLKDCLSKELTFYFIYASIIEPSIIPLALDLPESRFTVLDIQDIRNECQMNGKFDLYKKIPRYQKPNSQVIDTIPEPITTPQPSDSNDSNGIQKEIIHNAIVTTENDSQIQQSLPKEKNFRQVQPDEKIRVSVNFLNELVNLAGELVLGRNQLMQISLPLIKQTQGLNPVIQHISRITSEMQEKIMQMRMQPLSNLFGKFHRIVRDLAKHLNKDIRLVTYGEDVELDKSIIECLSDPMTHLVRNSIDHGIETPEVRESIGKQRQGVIEIKAFHQAGHVHIEIIDDGKGLNTEILGKKAIEKGIISREQLSLMPQKEIMRLIFKPGFSTAQEVTAISGRGVGMDVVLTNIQQVGGVVDIESNLGQGTQISLILPLTLAIVSGLVIQTSNQSFIVPESNIAELVRVKPEEVKSRINIIQNCLVLRLRELLLPLIDLKSVIGFEHPKSETILEQKIEEPLRILVLKHGNSQFGLMVDVVESIEEIVVKPLPRYIKRMKCFSGVSIMGDGTVSLILDVAGIFEKSALHHLDTSKIQLDTKAAIQQYAQDKQSLLIFDNKTSERFALPLELFARIEMVPASSIERIKDRQFIQYQNKKLRLIFLEDYLPVNSPDRSNEDTIGVIIPKRMKQPMGIVFHQVISTLETVVELDPLSIAAPGIFGSAILEGKITLIPDMYRLFELAAPEWYATDKIDCWNITKKAKILLVDDTPFFRMIEREYLISAGYDVVEAENGLKALQLLESNQVNGVLLDIVMPQMDGWEVIRRIREDDRYKRLPVMAVTSLEDESLVQKGLDAGFNAWEAKFNKMRLLEKLSTILSH
ncbi:MAG: hybrid sensor histidine kinase/response regulator [Desulfobacterales bacterium]|nr:hybrid sensor histidine kinase/response regulator [Desulfobacterales bacterium]